MYGWGGRIWLPGIADREGPAPGAGVRMDYESSLREVLHETQDGVVFRVRRGGRDGEIGTMTAGMLVGADGLHPRTRTIRIPGLSTAFRSFCDMSALEEGRPLSAMPPTH